MSFDKIVRGYIKKMFFNMKLRKLKRNAVIGDRVTVNSVSGIRNQGPRENVVIESHCVFSGIILALCGGKVTIGNNTYIGTNTYIMAKERVAIGNYCIIANDVIICDNNNHPIEPERRMEMSLCDDFLSDEKWSWKYANSAPIIIEDNTWIGRHAMIMKGVTIGKGSIVGAGAVVTHDVPPYSVAAGNPATVVKRLK